MFLQYAVLLAGIAASCAWQTRMTIKMPENNPLLNDRELGPLQNAWKSLEKASNDPYVLMFRSKNHEPNITCVTVHSDNLNNETKTANYTRTYFNQTSQLNISVTIPVRALNQTGYNLENVIRAGLRNETPDATPIPPGSFMYVEYGDYSCNSSSTPFIDNVMAVLSGTHIPKAREDSVAEAEVPSPLPPSPYMPIEGVDYLDFYVVFNQPTCNVLRAPLLNGGCDLWLRKANLSRVLEHAHNLTKTGTTEVTTPKGEEKEEEEEEEEVKGADVDYEYFDNDPFANAVFKSLPAPCRFAFLISCGFPNDLMYDEAICNKTEVTTTTTQAPTEKKN